MSLNPLKSTKLYYSIKEVAQKFNLNESILRYWETEFPSLKPKTTGQKVRMYTEKDIKELDAIYNLVKVRGFKLAAARKLLYNNRSNVDKTSEALKLLISVRDELQTLKDQIGRLE
jgi:DNA-binding transcriptional MerR regulator